MTTQITLPPATRSVGSADPPGDMNKVITALSAMGAVAWITPTGDTGGTQDTANLGAAIAALPAAGGTVWFSPGTFYVTCGSVTAGPAVYLQGCGRWATLISAVGTGDTIRMLNPTFGGGGLAGGGVKGLTIDGTNAGAGSAGLHAGDGSNYEWDFVAQNFTGTGSIGVHFDNTVWWTEKMHGTIYTFNCTQQVVFDVSGATTSTISFGYGDLRLWVNAPSPNQDGVVFQNGAQWYHGALSIRGNFSNDSSAQSSYVLRLTGTAPVGHLQAGQGSQIVRSRLDITVETSSNGGTHGPGTIFLQTVSAGNAILGCYGVMDFGAGSGNFTAFASPLSATANAIWYEGVVNGDVNLNPARTVNLVTLGGRLYSSSFMSGGSGSVFVASGDFFAATLSASITVNLNASTNPSAPRRVTLIVTQAASGGPFTVTWPHTGSPTSIAPTVLWAGGSAPVMSAGAGAVDKYFLETIDGATWIGSAVQNVS